MSRGNATIPFLYFTPPLDDVAERGGDNQSNLNIIQYLALSVWVRIRYSFLTSYP